MNITVTMPYSTLVLAPDEDVSYLGDLSKSLSFSMKQYNNFGPMTFKRVHLLESADGTQYKFRTGLLPKVCEMAKAHGLKVDTVDLRTTPPQLEILQGREVELWDYQKSLVKETLQHDMGTMNAATGAGKTRMACAMIARRQVSALFNVHTLDLLRQAQQSLEEQLGIPIGVIGGGENRIEPITVSTVQTLHSLIKDGIPVPHFDSVYIDEVHHLPAMMFYTVSGMFRARYVTGLSGTVYRKDGANLMIEAGAGPIVSMVSTDDLIRAERLARPYCYFRSVQAETSNSNAPRHAIINKHIVNCKARNEDIAAQAIEWASKGNSVLINVEWTKHGKILQDMIDGSHLLHGKDDQHTRLKVINMLREKKIHILISTLMREGVDAPSLNVTINAAGGTDPTQLIGRVLRRSEGKTEAVYVDYIDNQHRQLQRNSMARLKRCKQHKEFVIMQTA